MSDWRVLDLEENDDSFMKMATEEAIMNAVREKRVFPTLRFYSWSKPAVALGFFQQAEKELSLEACKMENVEIFRRITGGGAVYKSSCFELNYSFIIREDFKCVPKDVEESYRLICGAVMKGLDRLGFSVDFKPINDIMIGGKKVSGNAQTRVDNVLLHHGTILFRPEVEKMFKYLKIDDKKLFEKKVRSAKDLVVGLCDYREITKKEVADAIVKGFEEIFEKKFLNSSITREESRDAEILYEKYADEKFIFWR